MGRKACIAISEWALVCSRMAKDSKIEWTHHTFNPWWGCAKVSPACDNCYAESWAKRVGSKVWGSGAPRRFFGPTHWQEPLKWNAESEVQGVRRRVFCASMADVFERRLDLVEPRWRLWELIEKTPQLDWLLLTKRPRNVAGMVPWDKSQWPSNVWLGTTVENQAWADKRLPALLRCGAKVRFLSCEPMLGAIDLTPWLASEAIDWVIAGGESGVNSRPMDPSWPRALRDQCVRHGVAFHFKQWGHWAPVDSLNTAEGRVVTVGHEEMVAAGKRDAGRELDGRTWDQFPGIPYG